MLQISSGFVRFAILAVYGFGYFVCLPGFCLVHWVINFSTVRHVGWRAVVHDAEYGSQQQF
jgi:hypothetical protein